MNGQTGPITDRRLEGAWMVTKVAIQDGKAENYPQDRFGGGGGNSRST